MMFVIFYEVEMFPKNISATPSCSCHKIFWARKVRVDSGLEEGITIAHKAGLGNADGDLLCW